MSAGRRYRRRVGPVPALLPSINDDWPAALKDALAIRNAASLNGRCACGAVATVSPPGQDGVVHLVFEHEEEGLATDDAILRIAREAS